MKKEIYSPYAWFEYLFAQSFAIVLIVLSSKKFVVIPLALLITFLGLYRAFRSAMLTEKEIKFFKIFKGTKTYLWDDVARIRYQPPVRSKGNFKLYLKDGGAILFFSSEEVKAFIEKISHDKGIKWNG